MNSQTSCVFKVSFYQLRMILKIKPFLARIDLEKLIHVFIFSRFDYCNSLYYGTQTKYLKVLGGGMTTITMFHCIGNQYFIELILRFVFLNPA